MCVCEEEEEKQMRLSVCREHHEGLKRLCWYLRQIRGNKRVARSRRGFHAALRHAGINGVSRGDVHARLS